MALKLKPSHSFTFCLEKLLDLYGNHTNDLGLRDRSVVENIHNSITLAEDLCLIPNIHMTLYNYQ